MTRDYGAGLSVDELIGLTAWHIDHLSLPPGLIFKKVITATRVMRENELDSHILVELWEDGHSVWKDDQDNQSVFVTSNGQVIRK